MQEHFPHMSMVTYLNVGYNVKQLNSCEILINFLILMFSFSLKTFYCHIEINCYV